MTAETTSQWRLQKNIWFALIAIIVVFSIMRGIRYPNLWVYTQFLFNYETGFVKRGMLGELMRLMGGEYFLSYQFFMQFSYVISAVNTLLMLVLLRRFVMSENGCFFGAAIVFSSSLSLVVLAHTVGNIEHLALLVTLVLLLIKTFWRKVVWVMLGMSFIVLCHEGMMVIFYPVMFMSLLLTIHQEGDRRKKHLKWLLLAIISIGLVSLMWFMKDQILTQGEATRMRYDMQSSTGKTFFDEPFVVVLHNSETSQMAVQDFFDNKNQWQKIRNTAVVTLPSLLLLMVCFWCVARRCDIPLVYVLLGVSAPLSPLLLNFFGVDVIRWFALAIISAFLVLAALLLHLSEQVVEEESRLHNSVVLIPVCFLLVFVNGMSTIKLFDGDEVENFPFLNHIEWLLKEKPKSPYDG